MARQTDGFLLRFPELCDFILHTAQRQITIIPHEALDDFTIEHLLVDQVLPRLLAHEGHLLLHACAVNVDGRTLLFLGKSGWGKSTLAALFHQAGYRLYSDDCVLLKRKELEWQALATYPSLRLYEDSMENHFPANTASSPVSEHSEKQRISLKPCLDEKIAPVHAMYFLSSPDTAGNDIAITPMMPASTCIELIHRSFQLDVADPVHSRKLMASAAALTSSVPAFRLSYPHDFGNNARLLSSLLLHTRQ